MMKLGKLEQDYADSVIENIRSGKYSFEWFEEQYWDCDYESKDSDDYSYDPNPLVIAYIKEKLFGGQNKAV